MNRANECPSAKISEDILNGIETNHLVAVLVDRASLERLIRTLSEAWVRNLLMLPARAADSFLITIVQGLLSVLRCAVIIAGATDGDSHEGKLDLLLRHLARAS